MQTATKKKPENVITTGKVRLSYAHLFEPHSGIEGQEKKYSTSILIPKTDKVTLSRIKAAVEVAKQSGQSKHWQNKIPANLKTPLHDGDDERPDDPNYAGCYYLNASSKQPPKVVDYPGCNPILDQSEVYSGCYARVCLSFYPYSQAGNKGVGCGLQHVQKIADGEPLGGGIRVEDAFAEEFEDDDFLG